jgi:hypothetical protein
MKIKIIFALFTCLSLLSCNIPRPNIMETPEIETQGTDPFVTPQVEIVTSTFTLQAPSDTSESVTFTETPSTTPNITSTLEPGFGSISGNIYSYPYGSIPQLVIVAFEQLPPYHYWYVINAPESTFFSMDGFISTGKYQVVAYDPAGHTGGCVNIVVVKADEMITCDINNWGGGYPAKPAGIP